MLASEKVLQPPAATSSTPNLLESYKVKVGEAEGARQRPSAQRGLLAKAFLVSAADLTLRRLPAGLRLGFTLAHVVWGPSQQLLKPSPRQGSGPPRLCPQMNLTTPSLSSPLAAHHLSTPASHVRVAAAWLPLALPRHILDSGRLPLWPGDSPPIITRSTFCSLCSCAWDACVHSDCWELTSETPPRVALSRDPASQS